MDICCPIIVHPHNHPGIMEPQAGPKAFGEATRLEAQPRGSHIQTLRSWVGRDFDSLYRARPDRKPDLKGYSDAESTGKCQRGTLHLNLSNPLDRVTWNCHLDALALFSQLQRARSLTTLPPGMFYDNHMRMVGSPMPSNWPLAWDSQAPELEKGAVTAAEKAAGFSGEGRKG